MSFAITGIYASLLTLLMMYLGARVSIMRAKLGISILHGDNMSLAETIRKHANLTENLPMAIIVMGIAEAQGAGSTCLHTMGLILLVSRLIHPFGVIHDNNTSPVRALGATGTAISLLMAIGYILWHTWSAISSLPAAS